MEEKYATPFQTFFEERCFKDGNFFKSYICWQNEKVLSIFAIKSQLFMDLLLYRSL